MRWPLVSGSVLTNNQFGCINYPGLRGALYGVTFR